MKVALVMALAGHLSSLVGRRRQDQDCRGDRAEPQPGPDPGDEDQRRPHDEERHGLGQGVAGTISTAATPVWIAIRVGSR